MDASTCVIFPLNHFVDFNRANIFTTFLVLLFGNLPLISPLE